VTQRDVQVIRTPDPNGTALANMGRVAQAAANTWTLHEWARRLAAQNGDRNYLGQLEAFYKGILDRWSYVMENGEWVAGTPRALLGNVLGLAYQLPGQDPTRARVPTTPAKPTQKGFGDCDDVAALVAAGALAMGFQPLFRVARTAQMSHVSTLVRLPDGRTISVDPVGHPTYPFGWALPAQKVEVYDLGGQPTLVSASKGLSGMHTYAVSTPTLFSGFESGFAPHSQTKIGHWCATPRSDAQGPRVIATPERFHRLFMSGIVVDGAPGVDDFGNALRYDAMRDLWVDDRLAKSQAGAMGAGFFKRMGRRWKKRIAGVRKIIQRVAAPIRKLVAKLALSPVVQNVVGAALLSVGIPRAATKAVLEAGGSIIKQGGIPALIRMIRKDPKAAMRMVAQAAKAGLKRAKQVFSGVEDVGQHEIRQCGGRCAGHPVMALVGVPYVADFGELEISEAPAPGRWYRIRKGDTLLTVAQRAYSVPAGGERLKRANWINDAVANRPFFDSSAKDNLFKKGKISFSPKWSSDPESASKGVSGKSYAVIWIPTTLGDEPSAKVPTDMIPADDVDDTPPKVEEKTPATSGKPMPGSYYQVKKGDSLLAVTGAAYGVKSGSVRLEKSRWINDAKANAKYVKASLADSMYPRGRISFSSPYPLLWIPLSKGDEPVEADEGDLPPEDPKVPADPHIPPDDVPKKPDRPAEETESEKLAKFKKACESTPNGHFVNTATGPGCMVCHPEKGEVWNPVRQRCEVSKPDVEVDPHLLAKRDCSIAGGVWDASRNVCVLPKPKEELPDVDEGDVQKDRCIADGGAWDASTRTCKKIDIVPDIPDTTPEKPKQNLLPLLAIGALLLMGNK
jgi:hypothetical protein